MALSITKRTEIRILRLFGRSKRILNLSADIKPACPNLPVTFAIWNLVKRGDIKRIGHGNGLYRKASVR
jgi:hypothetical protein